MSFIESIHCCMSMASTESRDSEEVVGLTKSNESSKISPSEPFSNRDVCIRIMSLLKLKALLNFAKTCKWNNECSKAASIWKLQSERWKLPQVANDDGTARQDPKSDFMILYSITLSGVRIERSFRVEVIGPIPKIKQEWFDLLSEKDPFGRRNKISNNYIFVVVPSEIEIENCQNLSAYLKISPGSSDLEQKKLKVPFSFRNFFYICHYQLCSKKIFEVQPPCFDKSDVDLLVPKTNMIYLLRRNIVEGSIGLPFDKQEQFIKKISSGKFGVSSLLPQLLWSTYSIIEKGRSTDRPEVACTVETIIANNGTKNRCGIGDCHQLNINGSSSYRLSYHILPIDQPLPERTLPNYKGHVYPWPHGGVPCASVGIGESNDTEQLASIFTSLSIRDI